MSSNNPDDLYQHFKRVNVPSRHLRKQVINAALRKHNHRLSNRFSWQQCSAAMAVSVAFAVFMFIGVSSSHLTIPDNVSSPMLVQLHGFNEQETSVSQPDNYQLAKAERFDNYQQQQFILSEVHALPARVVESDSGLVLISCNDVQLHLSDTLLVQLQKRNQLPENLLNGDHVELALNQNGYIVGIKKQQSASRC